ncbi:MAG: PH domain-containing protein [Actinomycetota bacterium]|nr:PH domain-containing protein [Actinomycetota bacterium]
MTAGVEQDEWRGLHPSARTVWGLAVAVPAGLVGLGVAIVLRLAGSPAGAVTAVVVSGMLAWLWWRLIRRRWQAWGYAERERDLVIRKGVLVRRLTVVPYGRMQFVDVKQGPLARALGVSTVQLHTAAAATDARIPFVPDAEAARLRDRLTALGEAHAAGL